MKPWTQVTIFGVGLIGGSLGLALKRRGLARRVVGVGHRDTSLAAALAADAVDATTLDPAKGARGSDLAVLATPVGLFETMMHAAAPALEPGAVIIDVGSTKAGVVTAMEAAVPDGCAFVGCHPIAGSEQRGVEAAREDLFEGRLCCVTPTERTPPGALERVARTWQALGMRIERLSPEAHDRLLAQVSHLPHAAASALVSAIEPQAEALAGPGWTDTTRVASGDAALWRDILLSNATEVVDALERFSQVLAGMGRALRDGDAETIERMLAEAKARRDRVVTQQQVRKDERSRR